MDKLEHEGRINIYPHDGERVNRISVFFADYKEDWVILFHGSRFTPEEAKELGEAFIEAARMAREEVGG